MRTTCIKIPCRQKKLFFVAVLLSGELEDLGIHSQDFLQETQKISPSFSKPPWIINWIDYFGDLLCSLPPCWIGTSRKFWEFCTEFFECASICLVRKRLHLLLRCSLSSLLQQHQDQQQIFSNILNLIIFKFHNLLYILR